MTWEIVLGIIALVGFVISVGTIVAKASHTFAALNAAISALTEALKEFKKDSKTDRKELHDKVDDHEKRISNNAMRIELLETKVEGPNN